MSAWANVDPATSRRMRNVRTRGTGPELRLRASLAARRVRGWTTNDGTLPGTPDVAFHAARLAVFVMGCFWHGCARHFRPPNTRRGKWVAKVERNKRRDRVKARRLRELGWSVMVVWEHENPSDAAARIQAKLRRLTA